MKIWLTLAPIVFAVGIIAQQPPRDTLRSPSGSASARITGRVVSETGEPLRLAHVTVTRTDGGPRPIAAALPRTDAYLPPELRPAEESAPPETFTDEEGRFDVGDLAAGRYVVVVRKPGFVPTRYGARRLGEPPVEVEVGDSGRADIVVRAPRSAAISGRITDQYGEPIEGLLVTAERLIRSDGFLKAQTVTTTVTDDLGQYRLGGLVASRYVVNAWTNRPEGIPVTMLARTYFPGVIGLPRAELIEVRAGEERTSADFVAMADTAVATLTVSFFDLTGKPVSGEAALWSIGSPIPESTSLPGRDATVFGRVEPGNWTLIGRGSAGVGSLDVAIGSSDVTVTVTLGKGGHISGRIETDGDALPSSRFSFAVSRPQEDSVSNRPYTVRATGQIPVGGAFELGDLIGPTTFRLVPKPPRGWALKGIFAGDREVTDTPIDFKAGMDIADVRVMLTSHAATLNGTAVDAQGGARVDCSVLVFPEDRALALRPSRYARWARPNHQGHFSVDDLLPGNYLAIAVDDVDDTQWMNADYLDRFRAAATRVTLSDSETKTIALRVVTP